MNHAVRSFALCAVATLTLSSRLAHAQSTDTLPTLDDSPPAAVAGDPGPPAPAVVLLSPARKAASRSGAIRGRRRLALLGEVGWNGIAGFGPNLTYRLHPNVSIDLGAGLSLLGWKVGLRGRYLFVKGPVTPFIGAGVMGAAGFGSEPISLRGRDEDPTREPLNVTILPSAWMQLVGGVDWVAPNGFTLIGSLGYARVLSHDPVKILDGSPDHDEAQALNVAFRSSAVITIALGYSFR